MGYVDSHAHLTAPQMPEDLEGILRRAGQADIEYIVNICTDRLSLKKGLDLRKKHPWIFNAAAVTPHDVEKIGDICFPLFSEQAHAKALVAIGETGLDYYYEHAPKELQKRYLIEHLHLAIETRLGVIIHCRDAFSDLFEIVDVEYPSTSLILHCFTGTVFEAEEVIQRGWLLSLSGIVTFKKSKELRKVAEMVPIEQLLIETDAPYLAPQSKRGKRNEPSFLVETASLIAKIKNIPVEKLRNQTSNNAEEFFRFSLSK